MKYYVTRRAVNATTPARHPEVPSSWRLVGCDVRKWWDDYGASVTHVVCVWAEGSTDT